jgi:hypothetical protein
VAADPGLSDLALLVTVSAIGWWGTVRLLIHCGTARSLMRYLPHQAQRLEFYSNGRVRALYLLAQEKGSR